MDISKSIINMVQENLIKILSLRKDFEEKEDGSFVSKADYFLQDLLINKITSYFPNYSIISEELKSTNTNWNNKGSYIIIDPIDGTENFVSGLKEWGIGVSIFTKGAHDYSFIYLPELDEFIDSSLKINRFKSRISGISSSLKLKDLQKLKFDSYEYRITGCSMYNMFCAITGRFKNFENVKGVNSWDILPGINIAKNNNIPVTVNNINYTGELLFPDKKYKVRVG
mgnify:CR=1 FL=1|jgi:myo-inositol-1(or 4)-monophosphatase